MGCLHHTSIPDRLAPRRRARLARRKRNLRNLQDQRSRVDCARDLPELPRSSTPFIVGSMLLRTHHHLVLSGSELEHAHGRRAPVKKYVNWSPPFAISITGRTRRAGHRNPAQLPLPRPRRIRRCSRAHSGGPGGAGREHRAAHPFSHTRRGFKGTSRIRARAAINYHGNISIMSIARSRLTSQGQVSVPAEVRRRLGIAPGSVLEWDEDGGQIVVRRAGRYTSEDIHRSLFPEGSPKSRTMAELKDGIRKYIRKRHARR